MGFRLSKRINLGNGMGLNVSGSGVSASYRNRYGSLSSRGFSIKTGIPGLSYRGSFGSGGKKGQGGNIFLLIILVLGLGIIIFWNLIRMLVWAIQEISHKYQRKKLKRELEAEANQNTNPDISYLRFNENELPENLRGFKVILEDYYGDQGSIVEAGEPILILKIAADTVRLRSSASGKITLFKFPGEEVKNSELLLKLERVS